MPALSRDMQLVIDAIEQCPLNGQALAQALEQEQDDNELAALCIVAGINGLDSCERLWDLMDDDNLTARCAAWAMGQQAQAETFLCEHLHDAGIDQREQAYAALAYVVANNKQSDDLESQMVQAVAQELTRVQSGKTGMGEHACRILCMLGSDKTEALVKQVTAEDQYSDRYELQRLRKAVADSGKDDESLSEYARPWTEIFEDDCSFEVEAAEESAPIESDSEAQEASAAPSSDDAEAMQDSAQSEEPQADEAQQVEIIPIDWEAFLSSELAQIVGEQERAIVTQMGPMFEQLAAQALGKNLAELSGQELMILVLQILPQAIPPEYMQAALSPHALNGMQCLARYLVEEGIAAADSDLENGVRQIREHIQHQIRQSGGLHGSDYDEPDFSGQATQETNE